MKPARKLAILCIILTITSLIFRSHACTSAIAGRGATRDSTLILWKNRDTGVLDNFVERVAGQQGRRIGYVALYNAGDSTLGQAWAGVNEAGFGIINTASYNLAPDTASYRDREGYIMADALARCVRTSDFDILLDSAARPLGVQANFGVIDADGNAVYYEVNDNGYVKYVMTDKDCNLMIRTNYSYSGDTVTDGYGYIRHRNAEHLLRPAAASHDISPTFLTDTVSCSFYHSLYGRNMLADADDDWIVDQDFIPRYSTSASVAIVVDPHGGTPCMYVALGYPPCAETYRVTPYHVPDELRPLSDRNTSAACDWAMNRKRQIFSIRRGSGSRYINVQALREALRTRLHTRQSIK